MSAPVEVLSPGPLPIIKAVCEETGIIEDLNEQLDWSEDQCKLSPGLLLTGLIMNFLTEGQPMYRLSKFFQGTDTENLFKPGITPDDLNDDLFARALDKLSEADPANVLAALMINVAAHEDVDISVVHGDITSKSVYGRYDRDGPHPLNIAKGYSRGKKGLKQFNIGLAVNRNGFPVFGNIFDGNGSDKTWNQELITKLRQCLCTDEPLVYVADSAAMNQTLLDNSAVAQIPIITRLPRTFNAVDELIDRAWEAGNWIDVGTFSDRDDASSYKLQSFQRTIKGYPLRCVVVRSSSLDGRTERKIDNDLDQTEEELEDAVEDLTDRVFACEADAEDALDAWLDDHEVPCFNIDAEIVETEQKKSRDKPGRPPNDWEPYETVYQVAASVQRDAAAIATRKERESCFVVVTSLRDEDEWPPEEVLREYKEQTTVERRFPVVKDPKRVGPVYVKRPDRVEALGYVLLMALLVYSVIERRVRLALEDEDEPMKLAGGPTSFRPTGRRVLERFENMRIVKADAVRSIPDNVEVPYRVLELLGLSVTVYGVTEGVTVRGVTENES